MKKILEKINALRSAGFFDIFVATMVNSVVSFIYGIFVIRILSKNDYGIFSYVQNILNFGFIFCSLGGNLVIIQFCSEKEHESQRYSFSKYAVKMGSIGSLLVIAAMFVYVWADSSNIENLSLYVLEFSVLPFLYFVKEWIVANLRWQLKNREYAIIMNIHSCCNCVLVVAGAYLLGIQGVIIGMYLTYSITILFGCRFLKKSTFVSIREASGLPKEKAFGFAKYSLTMCVVNALISVLFTIDIFVIGNIMKDAEQIAMYKTATTIPFALNMIPNSIMIFVYPHIARHIHDSEWLKKNVVILYLANGAINITIGIGLILCAPILISILFGNSYDGILKIFRILVLSYMVSSCLRTPAANLLANLKKTKTALAVSVATVVLSVTLSINLVGRYGIEGAAWGSVCTFTTVGIISSVIIFATIFRMKENTQ